jgi:hypothetical protein
VGISKFTAVDVVGPILGLGKEVVNDCSKFK